MGDTAIATFLEGSIGYFGTSIGIVPQDLRASNRRALMCERRTAILWHALQPTGGHMPDKPYEDVQIEGHLIDSLMMPHIMDQIMDLDGEFEMLTFEVGRMKDDPSHAVMRIFGRDAAHLDELLQAITEFGVVAVKPQDAVLEASDMDGVFPDAFYSTTNLETFVRVGAEWVRVRHPEMDCGIRVDEEAGTAATVAMSDVQAGDRFVTGHRGIRVLPLERPRESQPFEFMASAVSSEKPKAQIVHEVARLLRQVKKEGRLAIAVVGPAVVHTGAAPHLARLIEAGYIAPSSAATPSPRTTSSRICSALRWASASRRGRRSPAATSITCAPSTPSAAAAPSRPPSSRASSPAASCTRSSRRARRSCSPAASATTAPCPR